MKYNIDKLNNFLVLVSFMIAVFFPFELFLLSYVVLGSLHYLTELIWLHKHNYFTPFSKKMNFLVLLLLFAVCLMTFHYLQAKLELHWFSQTTIFSYLLLSCFFLTWVLLTTKKWQLRIIYLSIGIGLSYFLQHYFVYALLTILLSTLIHVYIFTGLFMWNGSKQSKNKHSKITLALFVLVPFLCVLIPSTFTYTSTSLIKEWYLYSGFDMLYRTVVYFFKEAYPKFNFEHDHVIKLQRFIAFAYTYHYLNWFSKVELIKWHHTTKGNVLAVLIVWLAVLGVYIYDFKIGFLALYFFSLLHVVMEFPLNVRSIQQACSHD